jgi:dUTPase
MMLQAITLLGYDQQTLPSGAANALHTDFWAQMQSQRRANPWFDDLQGVVTARSSWAREGLSIATATIVNPGYTGIVTLELANLGEVPMRLYPGLRLAQIAFYSLVSTDANADRQLQKSQFNMSFEPSGGNIAKEDGCFMRTR